MLLMILSPIISTDLTVLLLSCSFVISISSEFVFTQFNLCFVRDVTCLSSNLLFLFSSMQVSCSWPLLRFSLQKLSSSQFLVSSYNKFSCSHWFPRFNNLFIISFLTLISPFRNSIVECSKEISVKLQSLFVSSFIVGNSMVYILMI